MATRTAVQIQRRSKDVKTRSSDARILLFMWTIPTLVGFGYWLVSILLLLLPGPAPGASREYVDRANGVRFRYPATWRLNHRTSTYIPPVLLQEEGKVEAVIWFEPTGTLRHTVLGGAEFLYRVLPSSNRETCYSDHTVDLPSESKRDWITVQGRPFLRRKVEGAGACHEMFGNVYAYYENNRCYLFETEMHVICAETLPGVRDLRPAEWSEIRGQSQTIVDSIRITSGPKGRSR